MTPITAETWNLQKIDLMKYIKFKKKTKRKKKKTGKKQHRNDPKAFSTLSGNLFQERSVNI